MIDDYSREKMASQHIAQAMKDAARERFAAAAARPAIRRSSAWSLPAVLRAFGFVGFRLARAAAARRTASVPAIAPDALRR